MAQTRDLALAQQWLALLPALEGVVAKKSDGHYAPGRRDWVKVKRQRTVDCVVIGLAGAAVNPALVLGLRHADGVLHHFAVTCPMQLDARGLNAPSSPCAGRFQFPAPDSHQLTGFAHTAFSHQLQALRAICVATRTRQTA
jgi:hypothetical protein